MSSQNKTLSKPQAILTRAGQIKCTRPVYIPIHVAGTPYLLRNKLLQNNYNHPAGKNTLV